MSSSKLSAVFMLAVIFAITIVLMKIPDMIQARSERLGFVDVVAAKSKDSELAQRMVHADFYATLNEKRAGEGLEPLTQDKTLERLAMDYANLCRKAGHISHDLIEPQEFIDLVLRDQVPWRTFGEVLQSGPVGIMNGHDIIERFMESPTHRDSLMDPKAEVVGVADVFDPRTGRLFVTAYTAK